jgi:hypothetical protein
MRIVSQNVQAIGKKILKSRTFFANLEFLTSSVGIAFLCDEPHDIVLQRTLRSTAEVKSGHAARILP